MRQSYKIIAATVACLTLMTLTGCETTGSGGRKYGKKVPGKPGMVLNPYSQHPTEFDVTGMPRGSEVKDPLTGQVFLVP